MANTKTLTTASQKCLFYGPAGTGKTTLASTYPNPHFVDLDNGMLSLRGKDINYITISAKETKDEDFINLVGKQFAKADPYTKTIKLVEAWANTLTAEDTLILDSLTFLNDFALEYVLKLANQSTPRIQDWGAAQKLLESIFTILNDTDCNLIIIAHDQFIKDDSSGVISWLPQTIGKLATKVSIYFDEVYRFISEPGIGAKKGNNTYVIETKPTRTTTAKSRLDLPARIENPTYEKIIELQRKTG